MTKRRKLRAKQRGRTLALVSNFSPTFEFLWVCGCNLKKLNYCQVKSMFKQRFSPSGRESLARSPPDDDSPGSDSSAALPWFDMALTCNLILRNLVDGHPRGAEGVKMSLTHLKDTLMLSHCTSRIIVICGLPTFYSTGLTQSSDLKKQFTIADH